MRVIYRPIPMSARQVMHFVSFENRALLMHAQRLNLSGTQC